MLPAVRKVILASMLLSAAACFSQNASLAVPKSDQDSISSAQRGALDNGIYRNGFFGFRYKVPFGWVDRTAEMNDASSDAKKSSVLLAVFERPPDAKGSSVNSAVVITAENASQYPDLKTATDYLTLISSSTTNRDFQSVSEPYYFQVSGRQLPRADFSKSLGPVTMFQSSLPALTKGYFVSFTFLGGSEDEVNELIEKLSFSTSTRKSAGR